MNFQIHNGNGTCGHNSGCWRSSVYHSNGVEVWRSDETLFNQTPWVRTDAFHVPERVYDPSTGKTYYHMIMGDMGDGFMQEVFIETASADYGTLHPNNSDTPGSASGGEGDYYVVTNDVWDLSATPKPAGGNGADPLNTDKNVDSGNGSGHPRKVLIRQTMWAGDIVTEFLKDRYDGKPRISQLIESPAMTQQFEIDMRHISYGDATTQAHMFNQMWLWGSGVPDGNAFVDVQEVAQYSHVSAGQFTYSDGTSPGGSYGSYSYAYGEFDHLALDWAEYYDPLETNPWAFEQAKDFLPNAQ